MKFRGAKVIAGTIPWLLAIPQVNAVPSHLAFVAWAAYSAWLIVVVTTLVAYESAEAWLEKTEPGFVRLSIFKSLFSANGIMDEYKEKRNALGLPATASRVARTASVFYLV